MDSVDDARLFLSRSICIKSIYLLEQHSETFPDLLHQAGLVEPNIQNTTFKIHLEIFGKKVSQEDKTDLIGALAQVHPLFRVNKVQLANPEHTFGLLFDYGKNSTLRAVYFGQEVGSGQRSLLDQFKCARRVYLGTTSMAAELCFLMANQGLIRPGSFVLDPFVGSGSLLLTAAHWGAQTLGCEIDLRVLRGEGPGKVASSHPQDVKANFQQYGLPGQLVDLVLSDQSRPVLRPGAYLDAILCDPPYGVRAGARKVGREINKQRTLEAGPEHLDGKATQTVVYSVDEVMADLLDFAACRLVLGGRLVFWLPSTEDFTEADIPSAQWITRKWARFLVTMAKTTAWAPEMHVSRAEAPAHADFSAKVLNDMKRLDNRTAEIGRLPGHVPYQDSKRVKIDGDDGPPACSWCGAAETPEKPFRVCSLCEQVRYCCKEHRKKHTVAHAEVCQTFPGSRFKPRSERNKARRERKKESRARQWEQKKVRIAAKLAAMGVEGGSVTPDPPEEST